MHTVSSCRCKAVNYALALALTVCGCGPASAVANTDWFGPGCQETQTFPQTTPIAVQKLLLQAYTQPDEPGTPVLVLRTSAEDLWLSADSLHKLDLPRPAQTMLHAGQTWYALSAIKLLHYRYDDCTQSLWLDTSGLPKSVNVYSVTRKMTDAVSSVQPGGYLNLDTLYTGASGDNQIGALSELGLFSRYGYGGTTALLDDHRVLRLDTNWNLDDPADLRRLTLGDSISRGSQFGQSVRFGGIQWGRAFSLQPDLVTFPQPSLRGNAALPSTVDVYVNQMLRAQRNVPAGPFELTGIPVLAGQGQVQLVTRDVLGRETVSTYPIYASQALLRKGLTDFTLEAGWQRHDYATRADGYGPFIGAATWRMGLTDALTTEVHAEETAGLQGVSSGLTMLVPILGTFSAGVAMSRTTQSIGGSYVLSFQRVATRWSVVAETRRADAHYTRIGDGSDALRASDLLSVGLSVYPGGSLSFNGLRQVRGMQGRSEVLGMTYSQRVVRDAYLSLSYSRVSSNGSINHLALLSLSYSFGNNLSASTQILHDDASGYQEQLDLQKNMGGVLGSSYRANLVTGANPRATVAAQWAQPRGVLSGAVDHNTAGQSYRADYSTGWAWLGRDVFWTRPVTGNFAVVDTQGVADIGVYADEHLMGHTDAAGLLLLPELRPYDTNHVRIDDTGVPIQYEINNAMQNVRLPVRGATRVVFPIKRNLNLLLNLSLPDGQPVPVGAQVIWSDGSEGVPVGYHGRVYVDDAVKHRSLTARWDGQQCDAKWAAPVKSSTIVNIICARSP